MTKLPDGVKALRIATDSLISVTNWLDDLNAINPVLASGEIVAWQILENSSTSLFCGVAKQKDFMQIGNFFTPKTGLASIFWTMIPILN